MFRSGGPIKEGIMDGMQDRPGYLIGGLIPLGAAAMRILPAAVRGFRTARTLTPGKLGTFGRIKDIFLKSKKKDDLADSYLQGIYWIEK